MLRGIPACISPDLMKVMMEMGHGDEIVLADGNFPAAALAGRLIRCDGHGIMALLDAILRFMPLDSSVEHPAVVMEKGIQEPAPAIWSDYTAALRKVDPAFKGLEQMDRFAFYDRARTAFAIVATSEVIRRANVILKKGVVLEENHESD